jgi:hypothetical protein
METREFEIHIKARLFSTLDAKKLKGLLTVALWDEADDSTVLDNDTDELEVIEYEEITVEEVV